LQQEKSISGQQAEDQVFVVEQDKATVEVDKANVETANINLRRHAEKNESLL
jgi:hypothetical protein